MKKYCIILVFYILSLVPSLYWGQAYSQNPDLPSERCTIVLKNDKTIKDARLWEIYLNRIEYEKSGSLHDLLIEKIKRIETFNEIITFGKNYMPLRFSNTKPKYLKVDRPKNSIYVELFGNGIMPSVNYERLFYRDENLTYSARIGFTPIHPKNASTGNFEEIVIVTTLWIPVTGSLILGSGSDKFELGIGFDIAPIQDDQFEIPHPEILGVLIAGYRFEPPGENTLIRISYTPFFGQLGPNLGHIKNAKGNGVFYHFAGISLGKRF